MALPSPLGSPRSIATAEHTPVARKVADGAEKVWVGVRLRPLLQHEVDNKETVVWRASGQGTLTCLAEDKNEQSYQYDRVFADSCSSDEVYATAAQPMVQSAMEGYNCTLFVYGQTGSGKTTTMRSFMDHAAKDIFRHIALTRNREFVLKMSAIEVYNEVVHDLFAEGDTSLKINDDRERGPVVMSLTEHGIESEEHLLKMLRAVEGRRQVRETKMNQKSSRSHLVVRLHVESRPTVVESDDEDDLSGDDSSFDGDSMAGAIAAGAIGRSQTLRPVLSTMNFVDLAGSERLSQANTAADEADKQKAAQKLAETTSINVSLLTLGKVIRALGKRGEHVPYRESNLTRILQPSLAGNSRMAIVCTLSPGSSSVENSRGTLHNFANHAKAVTMRPVLNEVREEQANIHNMKKTIAELKRKLERMDREASSRARVSASQAVDQQLLDQKNAELKAKDEQVRRVQEERDNVQKQLDRLKNIILRGGLGGSPLQVSVRRSFDRADTLSAGGSMGQPRAHGPGPSSIVSDLRRSWNPSTTSPLERERPSAGKPQSKQGACMDRSVAHPPRLLLECLLPPGVRDTISKLGEDAGPSRSEGPAPGRHPGAASGTHSRDLRAEIGKLQVPEGIKEQEAVSELQAEVRCLSHQPAAAAAVAGAAAATPETADHWIAQLTSILGRMEQRQREEQEAAGKAGTTEPMATDGGAAADAREVEKKRVQASVQEEAMERLRSEVARLQRMTAASKQTKQVLETVGKASAREAMDAAEVPAVVERLHTALQEADALEDGEEEDAGDQEAGPSHSLQLEGQDDACLQPGGAPATSQQRSAPKGTGPHARRRRATRDDSEVTSGQRYDPGAGDNVTTGCGAAHNPVRLSGSKLPRAQAAGGDDEDTALMKSPRRSILASPHDAAAGAAPAAKARASTTPNSRIPRPASCVTASAGRAHLEAQAATAEQQHDASPREAADADEIGLQRMRTPSVSMQASDGEAMSGGHRTASASSRGVLRWDADRAKRIISREKDAIHNWYAAEVGKLKAAYQEQAQADLSAMRTAMEQYRGMFEEMQERVERLTMHKQVLVKQVLQLELTLNEAGQQAEQSRAEIERLKEERDRALQEAQQANVQAQAERARALQEGMRAKEVERLLRLQEERDDDAQSLASGATDGWTDPPTSSSLLAEICGLWHQLHIPLAYRSRFFLLFKHKELIYLQMEECRLTNRMQQLRDADYLVRSRQLDKAKKALDLERKVLAQGLRAFDDAEKEELYAKWGVKHPKNRKAQLVQKLWDPNNTRDIDGMEASANLVVALAGSDATEQFVQLVFGNRAEAQARPGQVGGRFAALLRRVTTPRPRKGMPPAVPTASAATSTGVGSPSAAAAANGGGVTPRRQSSGILNMMGRVGSLLGQHGGQRPQPSVLGQTSGVLPPSAASTPRNSAPQQGPPLTDRSTTCGATAGQSGANPNASGQGPLTRGLGPPLSARGPAPVPMLPPRPGPPMSARGQPTYGGPTRS